MASETPYVQLAHELDKGHYQANNRVYLHVPSDVGSLVDVTMQQILKDNYDTSRHEIRDDTHHLLCDTKNGNFGVALEAYTFRGIDTGDRLCTLPRNS